MDVARDPARHLVAQGMLGVERRAGGDHAAACLQLPVAVAVQEWQTVRHPSWPEAADAVPQFGVEQLVVLQLGAVSTVQLNALGWARGGGALGGRRCAVGAVLQHERGYLPTLGLLSAPVWLFFLSFVSSCLTGAPGQTAVCQIEDRR